MSTFAWLIEAPGPRYLYLRHVGGTDFHWTADTNLALRFVSQEQADGCMMAIRHLHPDLFAFAATLGEAWPREHGFMAPPNQGGEG